MAQDDFLRYNLVGPDADHSDVDQAPPEKTKEAVITAVKAGYRMLDCANDYDNEHVIGEALQVSCQLIRGRDVSPRPI